MRNITSLILSLASLCVLGVELCGIKAHFTLGSKGWKFLGANFEYFWLLVCHQLTNKCLNIGPKGFYKLCSSMAMVSFFSSLGSIQCHKVQHLLLTWGRLKIFSCLDSLSVNKPLGFWFELNIGLDS